MCVCAHTHTWFYAKIVVIIASRYKTLPTHPTLQNTFHILFNSNKTYQLFTLLNEKKWCSQADCLSNKTAKCYTTHIMQLTCKNPSWLPQLYGENHCKVKIIKPKHLFMCKLDITNETQVPEAPHLGPLLRDSTYLTTESVLVTYPWLSAHFNLGSEEILKRSGPTAHAVISLLRRLRQEGGESQARGRNMMVRLPNKTLSGEILKCIFLSIVQEQKARTL